MNNPAGKRMSVVNMGCRVNWAEMDQLRRQGVTEGYVAVSHEEEADLVVINTCSVTRESERQARQLIRRVVRRNPQARVVVTGCYAERDPQTLAAIAGVERVVGNGQKEAILQLVRQWPGAWGVPQGGLEQNAALAGVERARVFLQVQSGCSERCTFCVIPPLRGPSRSLEMARALEEARGYVQGGIGEIVLSGINLGAYGRDLVPAVSLAELVEKMLLLPGLRRLRLSSLDPADLDPALVDLFGQTTVLCNHLHLSVQSGDDLILKRMARHCDSQTLLQTVARVRAKRPDMVFGADFIVGFPTESGEAFENSLAMVAKAGFALLHVFPYSDRPGTSAAAIPTRFHVAAETIRQRSERLRQAGKINLLGLLQNMINQEVELLVESVTDGMAEGKTSGFLAVCCEGGREDWVGTMIVCRITGYDAASLQARAVLSM